MNHPSEAVFTIRPNQFPHIYNINHCVIVWIVVAVMNGRHGVFDIKRDLAYQPGLFVPRRDISVTVGFASRLDTSILEAVIAETTVETAQQKARITTLPQFSGMRFRALIEAHTVYLIILIELYNITTLCVNVLLARYLTPKCRV